MHCRKLVVWIFFSCSFVFLAAACTDAAAQETNTQTATNDSQPSEIVQITPPQIEENNNPPETSPPAEEALSPEDTAQSTAVLSQSTAVITTDELGEFVIASTRFETEVRNTVPPYENVQFLVISLTRPGNEPIEPASLSLETFQNSTTILLEIEFLDSAEYSKEAYPYLLQIEPNRFHHFCSMGGWLDDEFVQVCMVPTEAATYTLLWNDHPPVRLSPEEVDS